MIFIVLLLALGLATKQPLRYWLFATAAVATQIIVAFLLAGGGTLEDPTRDGLITAWVRQATNDGLEMGLFGLAVIALGWGVPIWLVTRGFTRKSGKILSLKEEYSNTEAVERMRADKDPTN